MFYDEKIQEIKVCRHCQNKFEITDKDLEFYEKVSPTFGGKKYLIPTPSLCPDCRQQRKLSFRNVRNLYKRKCDATGKEIISIYSPDKPLIVYDQDFWRSDKWDPMDYGKEFDFSRGFFDQFSKLLVSVPRMSLIVKENENSDYGNYSGSNKNSYLLFNSEINENCMYVDRGFYNKNSIDCSNINNSENCFESIDISNSFLCFFSENLLNCYSCFYCKDCILCKNCYLSIGLNNEEFCFLNKKYSKEMYFKQVNEFNKNKKYFLDLYKKLTLETIHKYYNGSSIEKSSGDYLYNCKNVQNSYEIYNSETCKFCLGIHNSKNCYDTTFFGVESMENVYEGNDIGLTASNIYFSSNIVSGNSKILYSYFLYYNCFNCFGCVGLKNKSYCILNKQYIKEEYEKIVPKIIKHMMKTPLIKGESEGNEQGDFVSEWGEFFPSSISPFGYNETTAQEYFPVKLSEDRKYMITEDGKKYNVNIIGKDASSVIPADAGIYKNSHFLWSDYEAPFPKVDKIIPASKLPDDISKIPDDILNRAIMPDDKENEVQKPFRIIKQELEFYRKHNLPIPRKHPDQRHLDRMSLRNPRKLYDRLCDCEKCEEYAKETNTFKKEDFEYKNSETNGRGQKRKIKTTYSPDREEIVYCQVCYDKEIY